MRTYLGRNTWVVHLMVAVHLLASSGATISRMTCLEGGHSVVVLGKASDCCPDRAPQGPAPEVKAACCEMAIVHGERDHYLPQPGFELLASTTLFHQVSAMVHVPKAVNGSWRSGSRPPPLSTPDRLVVLGVHRV